MTIDSPQWSVQAEAVSAVPVTTPAEAKRALRLSATSTIHDQVLTDLIAASTLKVTADTEVVGINVGYGYATDKWYPKMLLPYRPIAKVDAVNYVAADGTPTVLPSDQYYFSARRRELSFVASFVPPDLVDRRDPISVTYTAGYGTDPTDVPRLFVQAVLVQVGRWFADPLQESPSSTSGQEAYDRIIAGLQRSSYP